MTDDFPPKGSWFKLQNGLGAAMYDKSLLGQHWLSVKTLNEITIRRLSTPYLLRRIPF